MPPAVPLDRPEDTLTALLDFWSGERAGDAEALFSEDVQIHSSHGGEGAGREAVADLLKAHFADLDVVHITSSNEVVQSTEQEGKISAYSFGEVRGHAVANGSTLFGGFVILKAQAGDSLTLIREIRMQMNWVQGNAGLLTDWALPVQDRAWQPGDRPATILSELDSPWAQSEQHAVESDEHAVVEAWYRYAWALDQGDFCLLARNFSEDAEAVLTPMGHLRRRRELVATLKSFRFPWPWMQHYGTSLRIEFDGEQGTARLWIGWLMPRRTRQA